MADENQHILAIDPALATGWAHSAGVHGVWRLDIAGTEHDGRRLVRMEQHMIEVHERYGVEHVAFEMAAYGSPHPATRQFHDMLAGVIIATAAKIGAAFTPYDPKTIKKFWTTSGNASKQDMLRHCRINGYEGITDDNEADAIAILELAHSDARNKRRLAEAIRTNANTKTRRRKRERQTRFT